MKQTTLSNLTRNELCSLDPAEPGVYAEVFKRFIDEPAQFDIGREEGFEDGYAEGSENIEAIRDLCDEQIDKNVLSAHPSFVSKALRELHRLIDAGRAAGPTHDNYTN
jgi:hypothetical protein